MELAAEENDWKVEKEAGDVIIKTKKNKDGRKVWLCTATVNVSPKVLWEKMKVNCELKNQKNSFLSFQNQLKYFLKVLSQIRIK